MNPATLLLSLIVGILLPYFHGDKDTDYYKFGWEEFYLLPEVDYVIDLHNPDYELLDAALFHATNKIRERHNKPLLLYSVILHKAAFLHSVAMIELDFYSHYNSKNKSFYHPQNRIKASGGNFSNIAENIADYQIIKTSYYYCPSEQKDGTYLYHNCKSNKAYRPYTYLEYATLIVDGWLNSPPHRINLLNSDLRYVGCAARVSKNPYNDRQAPFARITQNLGGGKVQVFTASDVKINIHNKQSGIKLKENQ